MQTTDGDNTLTTAITYDLGASPAHATGDAVLGFYTARASQEAEIGDLAVYTP